MAELDAWPSARPWSSGATPGGLGALDLPRSATADGAPRSFLEESDDLHRTGRDRLWPYCVRLKQSPVQRVLAERARQLTAAERPVAPPPFVDLGNFDASRRLPSLRPAAAEKLAARPLPAHKAEPRRRNFQERSGQRHWSAAEDDASVSSSAERFRVAGELEALGWGELDLEERPLEDVSIADIEAELQRVADAIARAKDEPDVPFDKTFHVPDRYREGYEDETAVTFGAVEEEEISKDARKLARPWRRAKPPLAMPFHRTLERRDLFLHATAEALARANAAADAENRAVHAEHLRRVRRALEVAQRRGNAAHARALDRLLAHAAATAARAAADDVAAAARAAYRDRMAELATYRKTELGECQHCGDMVPLAKMAAHAANFCRNRLQPCKNADCGCTVMVRPITAKWHEEADHLLEPRSCLRFPGAAGFRPTYVALDEADLDPPWTAEFWVWRPKPADALRSKARACLKAHRVQKEKERVVAKLEAEVKALEEKATTAFSGVGGETKEEIMKRSSAITDTIIETNAAMMDAAVTAYVSKNVSYELIRSVRRLITELEDDNDVLRAALEPMVHGFRPLNPAKKRFGVLAEAPPPEDAVAAAPASADPLALRREGDDAETPYYDSVDEVRRALDEVIREMDAKPHEHHDDHKRDETKDEPKDGGGGGGDDDDDDDDGRRKKQSAKERRATMRKKKKERAREKLHHKRDASHGKSVKKRALELLLGNEGHEAVAASSKCKLLFEVDHSKGKKPSNKGHLGVSFPGVGTFTLSHEPLPTERWVHVAFVASEQKSLSAFVDGHRVTNKPVVAPKGCDMKLPMRDIGGDRGVPHSSLHGLLLEARYWHVARTKQELKAEAGELPPADAKANGLVGWWTFEEHRGGWAHDRAELRYRSAIKGWTDAKSDVDPELTLRWGEAVAHSGGLDPPTPASLEKGVCQVELRRCRLAAKGREAFGVELCDRGCGAEVMRYKLRMHKEYECPLRPVVCPQCARAMPFSELARHERGDATAAPTCPVVVQREALASKHAAGALVVECYQGCGAMLKRADMDRHQRRDCEMRLEPCPNNCGESIAHCRMKDHIANFCGNPFFVAQRRMIRKYRHVKKYARPWATGDDAKDVEYVSSEDEYSDDDR